MSHVDEVKVAGHRNRARICIVAEHVPLLTDPFRHLFTAAAVERTPHNERRPMERP